MRGPADAIDLLARLGKEKAIEGGISLSRFFSDLPNDFLVEFTGIAESKFEIRDSKFEIE